MTKELLFKFLNDQCSEKELNEVILWFKINSFNEGGKKLIYQDWKSQKDLEKIMSQDKADILLDKIHHQINLREKSKIGQVKASTRIITWATRAAAILLFPVLIFLFYKMDDYSSKISELSLQLVDSLEVIAPVGSRTVVQLSDGSEVNLNYGSKIKYPQHFSGKSREVVLTGEGYFDVARNPDKPFVVKTGKLNVRAVGTEFNVKAYPEDANIKTTLVEGKVFMEKILKDGTIQTIGSLIPGQHVNYNIETEEIESTRGEIEKYIAWKDGKLIFENEPITGVAKQLSRMFNVDIEIGDKSITDLTYTVTFIDEPLFQILNLMTIATPVKYKAFPREKMPDGTFTKQKIIFEKR